MNNHDFRGRSVQECLGMYLSHLASKSTHRSAGEGRPFHQRILNKLSIDDYQLCEHVSAIIFYVLQDSRHMSHDSALYDKVTCQLGCSNHCLACGAFYKAVESVTLMDYSPEDDILYFINHPSAEPLLISQLKHSMFRGTLMGRRLSHAQLNRLRVVGEIYHRLKGEHSSRWAAGQARRTLPEEFNTLIRHRPHTREELDGILQDPKASLLSIDVSRITDMSGLFEGCAERRDFTGIEYWDVSNVTDMAGMFDGAVYFNQPLNNWDVSRVKDMSNMFCNARYFNQPLNHWETGAVEDMSNMFFGAREFNQPLEGWNVSRVLFLSDMFAGAENFDQPLEKWELTRATDMSNMFDNCGVSLIPSWFNTHEGMHIT